MSETGGLGSSARKSILVIPELPLWEKSREMGTSYLFRLRGNFCTPREGKSWWGGRQMGENHTKYKKSLTTGYKKPSPLGGRGCGMSAPISRAQR